MKMTFIILVVFGLVLQAHAEPQPPAGLVIYYEAEARKVDLRWPAQAGVRFNLYRADSFEGHYFLVDQTRDTIISDDARQTGFYYVTALQEDSESAPSNHVGVMRVAAAPYCACAFASPFGIPFKVWEMRDGVPIYGDLSTCPSDVVGEQGTCGTLVTANRMLRQDNGQFAYRYIGADCAWTNQLETNCGAVPGRCFWWQGLGGEDTVYVYGECDASGNYANITMPEGAFSAYSWRDPRMLSRDRLNLLASGFTGGTLITSDRVISQSNGAFFYYDTALQAFGGYLEQVNPGRAYWIQNKDHTNNSWSYNYTASGAP